MNPLIVSLEYHLRMCLEAAAAKDGSFASPSPACSIFFSTVKTQVNPSPGHAVPAPITLGIMRISHPQGHGKGKTLLGLGRIHFLLLPLTLLHF